MQPTVSYTIHLLLALPGNCSPGQKMKGLEMASKFHRYPGDCDIKLRSVWNLALTMDTQACMVKEFDSPWKTASHFK